MKYSIYIAVLLLTGAVRLQGQITESTRSMNMGSQNALILEIPNADDKLVEKWWKQYMKDYDAKTKRVKGSDEELSDDADIPGIGAGNTVDVYSLTERSGNGVRQVVWFDLGGAFLSSQMHGDRYVEGEKFMMRFGLYVTKEMIQIELKEEEKRMKDLESDLKKLQRDNEKLHEDIADYERRIEEAKAGIEQNLLDQKAREKDIESQQNVIEEVKKKLSEL
ncbi:MAG: hypothetical protein KDC43_00935 [Saprospiraceae bacterium]|nr:hypothetical protein [Saprospiraceae bacterium]MCB0622505.1 hypothetical protein [Saprospiraceae bacterium]MCB0678203.1 hypothetical protein [Saprospiraceae bacterium]